MQARGLRVFVTVWAGQVVSTLGSSITGFALGVWTYEITRSPTLYAVTLLISVLPRVLLAPVAGVVSDRWDRRLVMMLADTGAGISSLLIVAVLLWSDLQVWHIYVATFINSAFSAFQWPAYAAATSLLVPKRHLGRAAGMTQIGDALSQLAAPAIAGALFVTAGLKAVLVIDICSYFVALGTLLLVRFPQPEVSEEDEGERGSFLKQAVFGWTYIRERSGLLGLLLVFALLNFLVSITFALYTPLILNMTTPDVLGYLNAVAGMGMLVGTVLMSTWGGPRRRILGIYAAETVLGLTTFAFGLRLTIPLLALNNFIFMMAMPISQGCSQAIWQTKVAPAIQGRVFAIRSMIASSIVPLSYALAGPMAEYLFEPWMMEDGVLARHLGPIIGAGPGHGIALIFILAGLFYTLGALAIVTHPRIRGIESEIPDALSD